MKIDHIQSAMNRRPFKPFVVHTASGVAYPVGHPEVVARTTAGGILMIGTGGDSVAMVDVESVTEITYGTKPSPKS